MVRGGAKTSEHPLGNYSFLVTVAPEFIILKPPDRGTRHNVRNL
jgi:hypothetical protein